MADLVSKVAHYRFAGAQGGANPLEQELNRAFDRHVRENGNAIFSIAETDCLVFRTDTDLQGTFFHFVIFEEDAKAAVINLASSGESPTIREIDPESDEQEFIYAQIFVLIEGGHVVYLVHNRALRDRTVNAWIEGLINKGIKPDSRLEYFLTKQGSRTGIGAVLDAGIERIDMDIGVLSQAFEMIKRKGKLGGAFGKGDLTPDQQRAAAEVRAKVTLSAGRSWNMRSVISLMAKVSNDGIDEFGDDVKIYTKAGTTVTRDELVVKANVLVEGNNRRLSASDAEAKLRGALQTLKEQELIE